MGVICASKGFRKRFYSLYYTTKAYKFEYTSIAFCADSVTLIKYFKKDFITKHERNITRNYIDQMF